MTPLESFLEIAGFIILFYFLSVNGVYALLFFLGAFQVRYRDQELQNEDMSAIYSSNTFPTISFLIAMRNEEKHIVHTVESLLHLSYPQKKIFIINDGSTDTSLQILQKTFQLESIPKTFTDTLPTAYIRQVFQSESHPELFVIDKEHAGKYDALNAGVNACQEPFFIGCDADTAFDEEIFRAFLYPLLKDPNLAGLGASVRIKNGCNLNFNRISTLGFPLHILPAFQTSEYLNSFLARQGWNLLGGNFVIAGACAIFSTDVVREVGGFRQSSAEDMEMVVRIHRAMREKKSPYQIRYLPDPVAWTEAPTTLSELGKQRTRWHLGLLQTLWTHRRMLFNPRYGLFGCIAFPFSLWGEALEPVMELLAFIVIGISWFYGVLNPAFLLLLLLIIWGFNSLLSTGALLIEELSFKCYPSARSLFSMLILSWLQNFGYRQLTIFWRLRAFYRFFTGYNRWH
ncbi:MAG TPA: glycosyltransferase [Chlamydiales bacterium]|nr:MAG: hypothetical protein A3F67_09395 [Verrucomicrobia bacterium RIFCSPHIGHO2_12_FULL_41_10]HLB52293.1 glycosyltransferase [Chlamydiales bacterium]